MPAEIRRDSWGAVIFPEMGTGHTLFERLKTESSSTGSSTARSRNAERGMALLSIRPRMPSRPSATSGSPPQDRAAPGVDDPVMLRILSVGFHNGFR